MKNDYEIKGDITIIFLNKRNGDVLEAIIDTIDLPIAQKHLGSWHACNGYIKATTIKRKKITTVILHRCILNPPKEMCVDHINGNRSDNRRINLRLATIGQNNQNLNKIKNNNTSGVRGVHWRARNKRWEARIKVQGKEIYLGYFKDIKEAEKAVVTARAKFMPFSKEAYEQK
jgi:hypothetical protein